MSKIEVRTFNGLNINKIDPTMVGDNDSVAGSNIRIDNPYGTLTNQIGMTKWNSYSAGVKIDAILQLRKHRFTTKDNFNKTMFTLFNGNIVNGEIEDYYYLIYYYDTYTDSWVDKSNIRLSDANGCCAAGYDIKNNIFFFNSYGSNLYYGNLTSAGILTSISSFSIALGYKAGCNLDYENDIITLGNVNQQCIYKYKFSTGQLIDSYPPSISGIGNYKFNAGATGSFFWDKDTNIAHFADDLNNRIVKTKLDGLWTDWKTAALTGYIIISSYYCKYTDRYFITAYKKPSYYIFEIDIDGNIYNSLTTGAVSVSRLIYDAYAEYFYYVVLYDATHYSIYKRNFKGYSNSILASAATIYDIPELAFDIYGRWLFLTSFRYDGKRYIVKFNMDLF